MTEHAVLIAGGNPTGLMLAGELALAGIDVVIVERRVNQDVDGSRAGGLHTRTIRCSINVASPSGSVCRENLLNRARVCLKGQRAS